MANIDSQYKDFIVGVETKNDVPLVVSQYGFKKVSIAGKTFLAPMTREEAELVLSDLGEPLAKLASCGKDQMQNCYPSDGCKRCSLVGTSAGWMCICVQS